MLMSWCYCREFSSLRYLVYILKLPFYEILLENPRKYMTSYLFININELVLLMCVLEFKVFDLH